MKVSTRDQEEEVEVALVVLDLVVLGRETATFAAATELRKRSRGQRRFRGDTMRRERERETHAELLVVKNN